MFDRILIYRYLPAKVYNSHRFHQSSIVPICQRFWETEFSGYNRDTFRYETRFVDGCPCPRNKTYDPNYRLNLEKDQRLRFRNIRHKRYPKEKYCDPEWKHVIGKGHCHLFMGGKQTKLPKSSSQKKKQQLQQAMYDRRHKPTKEINRDKYVAHLKTIEAKIDSNLFGKLSRRCPLIKFSVGRKILIRKHIHNDKKIAFGSTLDSSIKAQQLTKTQLNKIKMSIREDRRLKDHPIMKKPIEEIVPRFLEKSKPNVPVLHIKADRRIFHFESLPKPKYLLEPFDVYPELLESKGYYHTKLNIRDYV